MVTRFRRRSDRTVGLKLGDEIDWTLRTSICVLTGLNETLGLMRKLAHLLGTEATAPDSSVPECELLGWRWGGPWPSEDATAPRRRSGRKTPTLSTTRPRATCICETFHQEFRRLVNSPPDDPQEIFIPLPVGIDWRKPGEPNSLGHKVEGGRP